MGGVGKTELALQYAIAYREIYKGGICWLLAKTGDVGIQIVQFARIQLDLNPPEDLDLLAQAQYCFRHWCEGEVLLVLDDVTEYQQVKPYLPSLSSRFKVLITTRQYFGGIALLSLDVTIAKKDIAKLNPCTRKLWHYCNLCYERNIRILLLASTIWRISTNLKKSIAKPKPCIAKLWK